MTTQQHYELASAFFDGYGLAYDAVIETLTGVNVSLPIEQWFKPLEGIDGRTLGDLEDAILTAHFAGVKAAFAAGIAVGLHPEQVLLVRKGGAQ